MSKLRTLKYLSSLILCLLVFTVQAQKIKLTTDTIKVPSFNGITIQTDVASIVSSFLSNGVIYSYEGAAQVDFKHKYFPVLEFGIAGANKLSNDNINFKTNGLFGKLGIDINLLSPKKDSKPTSNLFLAGVRLGLSNFNYKISDVTIIDDYWGGSKTFDFPTQNTTKIWYEIALGIRVEVLKNIFMGWTIRSKNLLSSDITGSVSPWYIPGFGINTTSNWGLNYTIGYKFQLPHKTKTISKERNLGKIIKQKLSK
jgi:hypothetical protein